MNITNSYQIHYPPLWPSKKLRFFSGQSILTIKIFLIEIQGITHKQVYKKSQ